MLVVKLGGSYAHSEGRGSWLAAIAAARGPVVLVPGGGPFADAVRQEQARMGYDDRAAHDMALMAMAQYGTALAATAARFVPADDLADIARATDQDQVAVWRPWPMLRDAPDVEVGWHVTSDSLSLVLAARLGARAVLLLKQVRAAEDLVDAAFPAYRVRFPGEVWVAAPEDAPEALDAGRLPGLRLP